MSCKSLHVMKVFFEEDQVYPSIFVLDRAEDDKVLNAIVKRVAKWVRYERNNEMSRELAKIGIKLLPYTSSEYYW